jgi:5-(carboxyamino)imidazole ribonucleotide synthase
MILPPATIGMLGGGQLGRFFAMSARSLGYTVHVVEPDPYSPAAQIADKHIQAAYDDKEALQQLRESCAVITTEFENIPASVLDYLAEKTLVRPNAASMSNAQDRIDEKAFIKACGLLTAPYGVIRTSSDIATAIKAIAFPCILKTARFGYDGKGQITANNIDEVRQGFAILGNIPCVLEQKVNLETEISVILGRNQAGESECFPVAENIHHDGILFKSIVPANVATHLTEAAQIAAKRMANKLDYVGVLAVEFIITQQGVLLVNEIAPRVHNSGHYTLDACITSQFEQQLRMVCDLPFGSTKLLSPVVMINILGDVWNDVESNHPSQPNWQALLSSSQTKLHLYGKTVPRIGRKMGHFCVLAEDTKTAEQEAKILFEQL